MNFYLSAIDDQLRHADDQPSIGIILCKERNEIVVEYALRDSARPMGVAQYRLSPALPERLKQELPTVEDLEPEFCTMAFIALRRKVDYTLRDFSAAHDIRADASVTIESLLSELKQRGVAPANTDQLVEALQAVKTTARGFEVDPAAAAQAAAVGRRFIAELSGIV